MRSSTTRTLKGLSCLFAAMGLLVGAKTMSGAGPVKVLVHDSPWSLSGAASAGGFFTNFLLPPTNNPSTYIAPSSVIFGNVLTVGAGADTFNTPVDLLFSVTSGTTTHQFDAHATITGALSDTNSNAHVQFDKLTDLTTGASDTATTFTDPGSRQFALFVNSKVGGVYVDFTQPIPTPTQNQATLSGYISPAVVPEMATSVTATVLLAVSGGLGFLRRKHSKQQR